MSYFEYSYRSIYGWIHTQYVTARIRWRCWQIERALKRVDKLLNG